MSPLASEARLLQLPMDLPRRVGEHLGYQSHEFQSLDSDSELSSVPWSLLFSQVLHCLLNQLKGHLPLQ